MKRPELTQRQQSILMAIGKKDQSLCDKVELHIRQKTAELSFQIEQAGSSITTLKDQLKASEGNINILIGKFLAMAELAEAHATSKAKAPKCGKCGKPYPGELPPQLTADDIAGLMCPACTETANGKDGGDAGQQNQIPEEQPATGSPNKS